MKKIITLIAAALICSYSTQAWTDSIHAGIAAIAQENLKESTKQRIAEILDGRSIVYIASMPADNISGAIAITAKNKPYSIAKVAKSKDADIRNAALLSDITLALANVVAQDKKVAAEALRELITAIGDMHCPGHYLFVDAKHYRDIVICKAWNSTQVKFTEFWESDAFYSTYGWTTNEFVHQLARKTPEQIDAITNGSYNDWVVGNAVEYRKLYQSMPAEITLAKGIDYTLWKNKLYPVAIEQIAVAGYRLAAILNLILD